MNRQMMLTGAFDDEALVPGVWGEGRVDVCLFGRVHKQWMGMAV
jgi:hypothetical protein